MGTYDSSSLADKSRATAWLGVCWMSWLSESKGKGGWRSRKRKRERGSVYAFLASRVGVMGVCAVV